MQCASSCATNAHALTRMPMFESGKCGPVKFSTSLNSLAR